MAQLIVFGGGDSGCLFIGPKGVRPIPAIDPAVRSQLRGLSALLNGSIPMEPKQAREMATLTNKVSNLLFTQVEGIVGPLEGEQSLIYQDEDGGFYCGSTGKPPVPIQWPPRAYPNVNDLIAAGVLEQELLDFMSEAEKQKMDILKILEDPAEAAAKLGLKLSERTIKDLRQIAPSQIEKISDPISREIIQFFHAVAKDGRFLTTWTTRPYEVAGQLKIELSDPASERILNAGASLTYSEGRACILIIINIVAWIVCIVVILSSKKEADMIKDSSGIKKF